MSITQKQMNPTSNKIPAILAKADELKKKFRL